MGRSVTAFVCVQNPNKSGSDSILWSSSEDLSAWWIETSKAVYLASAAPKNSLSTLPSTTSPNKNSLFRRLIQARLPTMVTTVRLVPVQSVSSRGCSPCIYMFFEQLKHKISTPLGCRRQAMMTSSVTSCRSEYRCSSTPRTVSTCFKQHLQ